MRKDKETLWKVITVLSAVLVLSLAAIPLTSCETPDPSQPENRLEILLEGEKQVILEYGSEYQEPGAAVVYNGEAVDVKLDIVLPDFSKVGSHEISYTATYEGLTAIARRTVIVQDSVAPVITLHYKPGYCPEIGEEYQEEGYTATDNYDGDITDKVVVSRDGNTITYKVTDSSGNSCSVTREIVFGDTIAPEITLKGENTVYLMAGKDFTEPGFTAVDNVDGDITENVRVTGWYDKYLPGTYTYTYTVTDAHGNSAEVTRHIVVEGVKQPDIVDPGKKVIYLTFDDGPSQHTYRLLDILAKYNVKATFFVVGEYSSHQFADIVNGGHAIGVHTYSHEYSEIYASEDAFFNDFYKTWNLIKEKTGVETTLMRFPGGSSNRVSISYCPGIMTKLTQAVEAMGYQYFDWNVDSGDAGKVKTSEEVFQNVINGIKGKDYSIVLQHDIYGYSVDAVERIIQWGLSNGYSFQALTPNSPTCHQPIIN